MAYNTTWSFEIFHSKSLHNVLKAFRKLHLDILVEVDDEKFIVDTSLNKSSQRAEHYLMDIWNPSGETFKSGELIDGASHYWVTILANSSAKLHSRLHYIEDLKMPYNGTLIVYGRGPDFVHGRMDPQIIRSLLQKQSSKFDLEETKSEPNFMTPEVYFREEGEIIVYSLSLYSEFGSYPIKAI